MPVWRFAAHLQELTMDSDLEQRIRERAYEIWENEGCPEGRTDEHWQQACAEYSEALAEVQSSDGGGIGVPVQTQPRGPNGGG
jgi:hypothetical protein